MGKPLQEIAVAEGFDTVAKLDGVIDVSQALFAGDTVGKDGTTAQVLGSVWFKAADFDGLCAAADTYNKTLCFKDAEGNTLLKGRKFTETH